MRSSTSPAAIKAFIRRRAMAYGFDRVGFAAAKLPQEAPRLAAWLRDGFHGEMRWMERGSERRTDASRNLPGARTLVCCALNYYQGPAETPPPGRGVISSYARGEDYHRVLEGKLRALADEIQRLYGVSTRVYVDTGPVLEKSYAVAAGLGWLGKHSNLIAQRGSSWFFLGEILLPIELPPDAPGQDRCGTCTRCITACPTGAIVEPYVVDSRLCISYLTIELRGPIPRHLRRLIGLRIYGCDDCQDVCPWNRFAHKSEEAAFLPKEPLATMDLASMLQMSRETFSAVTRGSAIRRARYSGFLRNVAVALGNTGDPGAMRPLVNALEHEERLVRGHAAWALGALHLAEARAPLSSRLQQETDAWVGDEIRLALRDLSGQGGD